MNSLPDRKCVKKLRTNYSWQPKYGARKTCHLCNRPITDGAPIFMRQYQSTFNARTFRRRTGTGLYWVFTHQSCES